MKTFISMIEFIRASSPKVIFTLLLIVVIVFSSCKSSIFCARKYTKGRYIEKKYCSSTPSEKPNGNAKPARISTSATVTVVDIHKVESLNEPLINKKTKSISRSPEKKDHFEYWKSFRSTPLINSPEKIKPKIIIDNDDKREESRDNVRKIIKVCLKILLVLILIAAFLGVIYVFQPGLLIYLFLLWLLLGAIASIVFLVLLISSIVLLAKSNFRKKTKTPIQIEDKVTEQPKEKIDEGKSGEIRKKMKRFLKICGLILLGVVLVSFITMILALLGVYGLFYVFIAALAIVIAVAVSLLTYFIIQTLRL